MTHGRGSRKSLQAPAPGAALRHEPALNPQKEAQLPKKSMTKKARHPADLPVFLNLRYHATRREPDRYLPVGSVAVSEL